jgi:riboflavin synthase
MFTGIVQGIASIQAIRQERDITRLVVAFPKGALASVQQGASISINGCCLTVTGFSSDEASFDLVPETMTRTMFHTLKDGARVNFERSLKFGDEVGGHVLSGHVDVVAELVNVDTLHESRIVTFKVSPEWAKYLFTKGYIAVQGASLTLTGVDKKNGSFTISLIPETLAKTTFGEMGVGALANIEIDRTTQVVVDTVERMMRETRA